MPVTRKAKYRSEHSSQNGKRTGANWVASMPLMNDAPSESTILLNNNAHHKQTNKRVSPWSIRYVPSHTHSMLMMSQGDRTCSGRHQFHWPA